MTPLDFRVLAVAKKIIIKKKIRWGDSILPHGRGNLCWFLALILQPPSPRLLLCLLQKGAEPPAEERTN